MEREANLLRCAKLNCYAEFNRMVYAITRSGGEAGFQLLSGSRMAEGNSAEYFFYTTLVSMLNQVVRNTNSVSQQVELQQVYQWFCTNKPLITAKTNTKQQKPKLSLSSRQTDPLYRPQTVPATQFPPTSVPLPSRPRSHGHPRTRPLTVCGFTSGYMSHSLALSQEEPGQLPALQADHSRTHTPSYTYSRSTGRSVSPGGYSGSHHSQGVSVVEVPAQQAPSHGGQPATLNTTTLLQLVPAVAASMEWQREMRQVIPAVPRRNPIIKPMPMPVEPTTDDGEKEKVMTDRVMTSTAEPSNSPQQDARSQTPPASQPHHPSNVTMITRPPSQPHKPHTHTVRAQPPVHVVTLGLPLSPQHTQSTRRTVPSGLKRRGPKIASGFNCSRYRPGSGRVVSQNK